MTIQPDIKFYDTSSLLIIGDNLFNDKEPFIISSITLKELELIKSSNKDEEIKRKARNLLNLLNKYQGQYEVIIHKFKYELTITLFELPINHDTQILSDAIYCNNNTYTTDRIKFITNDLFLKQIANLFFGTDNVSSIEEPRDLYTGYREICCTEQEIADFYSDLTFNWFHLLVGEYLILKSLSNDIIDLKVWTGETHRSITYGEFTSDYFGKIKPYEKDVYQQLLFDSLLNNKITMVRGPAGAGKSAVALGYLMSMLEKNKINKIVIFCNTVATANSAKLGFYPGSKDDKLLDSQIGNFLVSKFGGKDVIDALMMQDKLKLLPFSDIRGYDTTGMQAGIYITEAQNLDITLMKLALQRIGEDCICIIDGDDKTQVDDIHFSGNNNGMRRASQVFRGHNIYGEVTLKNIYRSKISKIAEKM